MKKGTVLSTNQKWAIVFTEDCQLEKLPLQPHMAVGKEIHIQMQEHVTRVPTYTRRFKPALIAASFVLVLAMTLLLSQGLFFNPVYATVSVDINPSVQFGVNRNLEVIAVQAMNQEAAGLLEGETFMNMGVDKAIQKWKEIAEKQYQVKTMLLAAVMPENADALREMLIHIEQTQNQATETKIKVQFIYSDEKEVIGQAEKNGLSVGRQMLLNQSNAHNQGYDVATIAQAPLDELLPKLIKNQERSQSGVTQRTTQSASESNGPNGTQNQGQNDPTGSQNQTQQSATGSQNQTQQTPSGSIFQTKQTASGSQYTTQQTPSGSTYQTSQTPSGSTYQTQQTPSGSTVQTQQTPSGTTSQSQSDPSGTQNTSQKAP